MVEWKARHFFFFKEIEIVLYGAIPKGQCVFKRMHPEVQMTA